jgi:hypothetical protein
MRREGVGWRLEIDRDRIAFQVLIGSDNWALELSLAEFEQLRGLCARLICEYEKCLEQLMPEEKLQLELEQDCWWLELNGDSNNWSLRFVLTPTVGQRGAEGGWDDTAAPAFCRALALADVC